MSKIPHVAQHRKGLHKLSVGAKPCLRPKPTERESIPYERICSTPDCHGRRHGFAPTRLWESCSTPLSEDLGGDLP